MKSYVLLLGAALASQAVAQPQSARPDPTNPAVAVPVVKYESAFAGYRPHREQELSPWRELNEDVAKVGGHIGIFRGAGHAGDGSAPAKPSAVKPATGKTSPSQIPSGSGKTDTPRGDHKAH